MLKHIRQTIPKLSAAEKRVAEVMLTRPQWFTRASVAEIANYAEVSQPTVIRFCRHVGFQGLPEFKTALAHNLEKDQSGLPYVHTRLKSGDSTEAVMDSVLSQNIAALRELRQCLEAGSVETAITWLAQARRIEIYGVGNSGIVAQDAQHKLFRFGLSAIAYQDTHVQMMAAALLQPQDVVLSFSQSGGSHEIIEATRLARQNGAKTIAITPAASVLAKSAECVLAIPEPEEYQSYTPTVSRLMQLTVVDTITVALALTLGEKASLFLHKAQDGIRHRKATPPEDIH